MALLSQMIRSMAITGGTDASSFKSIAGRQGGRWADQHIRTAFPAPAKKPAAPADPAGSLRTLTELRDRGALSDDEFEHLRARLQI